jgi:hypothetical protein
MRDSVYDALKKKLNIESVRIYNTDKNPSTMVHIIARKDVTGFKRDYFKTSNKSNGGTKLLIECEAPFPWKNILSGYKITQMLEELFDKNSDV